MGTETLGKGSVCVGADASSALRAERYAYDATLHAKKFDRASRDPGRGIRGYIPFSHKFSSRRKKVLHLRKFPVISHLRTNSAEMPVESLLPREPRNENQGRRGGESESLAEEAIEIGNS